MPYTWVKPKVALAHRGVKIYHVYKNDNADEGVREYWYGWSPCCTDSGDDSFDVRDLADMLNLAMPISWKEIVLVLKEAIDRGVLTKEGIKGLQFQEREG